MGGAKGGVTPSFHIVVQQRPWSNMLRMRSWCRAENDGLGGQRVATRMCADECGRAGVGSGCAVRALNRPLKYSELP